MTDDKRSTEELVNEMAAILQHNRSWDARAKGSNTYGHGQTLRDALLDALRVRKGEPQTLEIKPQPPTPRRRSLFEDEPAPSTPRRRVIL